MKRPNKNLLYSVYASKLSDEWKLNIEELNRYASVFNGTKVALIRTDGTTVQPKEVIRKFGFEIRPVIIKNYKPLGEVAGFLENLNRFFYTTDQNELLFYAHTKGTSYHKYHRALPAVRFWRNTLYRKNLSDIVAIERVLGNKACAGCFRVPATKDFPYDAWHYSGNFWWVNLGRLFETDWNSMPINTKSAKRFDKYAIEFYVGSKFPIEQSHCIICDRPKFDPYNLFRIREAVMAEEKMYQQEEAAEPQSEQPEQVVAREPVEEQPEKPEEKEPETEQPVETHAVEPEREQVAAQDQVSKKRPRVLKKQEKIVDRTSSRKRRRPGVVWTGR
jgi:hypothetical protein